MTKINVSFKSKHLTRAILASTLFITLGLVPSLSSAAVLVINGSDQAGCPIGNCGNNGAGGVEFQTDNTLIVTNGQNIGQTNGISVTVTGANDIGRILFTGTSSILGSVSLTGNILRMIELNGPGTVTATSSVRVTSLNLNGPNSTFLMADGTDLRTTQVVGSNVNSATLSLQGTHNISGDIGSPLGSINLNLVGPSGTVRTDGDIVGPVTFINSDQDLLIANNKNIVGSVTTTVSGQGAITFQGNSIGSAAIGTDTFRLRALDFNSGIYTTKYGLAADTITIDECATLLLENNALGGTAFYADNLYNSGILQLGTTSQPSVLGLMGNYIGSPGSSINFMVTNGAQVVSVLFPEYSRFDIFGNPPIIPAKGIHINVSGNRIANNKRLILMAAPDVHLLPDDTIPNTATYQFVMRRVNADLLEVDVKTTPMSVYVAQNPLLSPIARFFDTIGPSIESTYPDFVPIYDALNAQADGCTLANALANLTLPVSGNLLAPYHGGVTRGFQVIAERMDNNRGEFTRGETRYKYRCYREYCENIPCDYYMRPGQWIEFYGAGMRQKDEDIEGTGYRARQWTLIAGYDKTFYPSFNAGVAVAYSQLQSNSKGVLNNQLEADTYQGYLYASHEHCNGSYWDAIVSVAYNDYFQDRNIDLLTGINLDPTPCGINAVPFGFIENAHSRFGGWQFNGYFEGGYQFRCNKFVVIPHGIFRTTYLRLNEFSEDGAPLTGFKNVQYDDMQELELGGGLKVAKNFIWCKKYKFTPYIKLVALHDFKNTPQKATYEFALGAPEFTATGFERDSNSLTTSLGLTLNRKDNTFITLEYDFEKRSDFSLYAAFLKYRVEWC